VKISYYTLGCKLNFSETSAISRQFENAGFSTVEFTDTPDIFLINTCSVTEHADKKCRKIVNQALKINPEAFVAITGCYAQLKPKEITSIPGVDAVFGAAEKFRIPEILKDWSKREKAEMLVTQIQEVSTFSPAFSQGNRTRSFLKVQDGCDYKCTFCTIPLARGKSRSATPESVIAQAQALIKEGVKEIVLAGVNTGDYGKGLDGETSFFDLLKALDKQVSAPRIRISSIEPNLLEERIISFISTSERIMPHFHIPLQSGSNEILRLMKRRYRKEHFKEKVDLIRSYLPDASIGVDVITGFPGETEEHFMETYTFLNELDVTYLHVFTYSERINTPAFSMSGRVENSTRNERTERLRILSEKKRSAFERRFIDQTKKVLFEDDAEKNMVSGYTDNYIRISIPYDPLFVNEIMEVTITGLGDSGHMTANINENCFTYSE